MNIRKLQKYCCEDLSKIENYDKAINDKTQAWRMHHRAEVLPCGNFSVNDLKKFGLYYNRPANELIFLSISEHMSLHSSNKTKKHKEKIIAKQRGRHITEKHKKQISKKLKGRKFSDATLEKMSIAAKGRPAWNKGIKYTQVAGSKNGMFGRSAIKGRKWYTNGKESVLVYESPGDGWTEGRICHRRRD